MESKRNDQRSFLFSPTLFDHPAVMAVREQFGAKGELTAVKLVCETAMHGYSVRDGEELRQRLLKVLPGVSYNLLGMIINVLVGKGLFDRRRFKSGILESSLLKRSYLVSSDKTLVSSEETIINSEETKETNNNLLNNKDYGTTTEARP